ncbi:bro-a [Helicoverpa armigera nucleopolyhedrovirus]|uniref:Bro-a n=1 Tax=Helicoverpa armigera nucleopolyhedrovirus TaxID=51313 RepID=Q91BW9_9ABAC|nr:bro-a [Helicoverpa armigera nucleopolyhedrovirus]AAK96306.1 bro-a [Helicoverpa armigera nucleopolyhedrovirus]
MSLTKIQFGDKEVETYTVDFNGEKWMVANPFAEALNYSRANKAILEKVSDGNQKTFDQIKPYRIVHDGTGESSVIPRNMKPNTKFINRAGVFELIMSSQMEYARQFRYWLSSVKLNTTVETDSIAEFNEWRADAANMALLKSMVEQRNKNDKGVVYVVTNRLLQMIDAYKIGYTFDLTARLNELNVASPLDFKSVFVRESSNPYDLEQKLHRHFHESRIKREFFKLTEEDLVLLPLICDNLLAQ